MDSSIASMSWSDVWRSSPMIKFGFHGKKIGSGEEVLGEFKKRNVTTWEHNVWVVIGMIPVIGAIVAGIRDMAIGLQKGNESDDDSKDWTMIAKGAGRLVLGPVIPLLDIVATLGRYFTVTPETKEPSDFSGNNTNSSHFEQKNNENNENDDIV